MSFNSDSKSIEKYHLLYIFLCSKVHKKLIYLTNSYKILVIKKKLKKKNIYIDLKDLIAMMAEGAKG